MGRGAHGGGTPAAAAVVSELRRQIKAQYQGMALTMDDYTAAPERCKPFPVPDSRLGPWRCRTGSRGKSRK